MSESLEVSVARMQEQLKTILAHQEKAEASRKDQYGKLEEINTQISSVSNRLTHLERQFSDASPTISEFIAFKHRLNGAGTLGKWLWVTGGFMIGALASLSGLLQQVKDLLSGN